MAPRLRLRWEAADPGNEDLRLVVTLAGPAEQGRLPQCKQPTEDGAAMIAALKAVRDRDGQDVRVIVIEGKPTNARSGSSWPP